MKIDRTDYSARVGWILSGLPLSKKRAAYRLLADAFPGAVWPGWVDEEKAPQTGMPAAPEGRFQWLK